jgi:transcriptional regulator with XRE-family HTH domain
MDGRYTNYFYTECGLDNVVLKEILVYNCSCGAIVPEIVAISGLHRFIALSLLKKPAILDGKEVRFLRKFVNYSATELADVIGSTKVTMSRWENGAPITKNSDRLLRLAFFAAMLGRDAKEILGDSESQSAAASIVVFANTVKSFDLPSFLRTIKDHQERTLISVDPSVLLRLGDNMCIDIASKPVVTSIQ